MVEDTSKRLEISASGSEYIICHLTSDEVIKLKNLALQFLFIG